MGFAQEMKDFLGASQAVIKTFSDKDYKSALSKYTNTQEEKMRGEMPLDKQIKEAALAGKLISNAADRADNDEGDKSAAAIRAPVAAVTAAAPRDLSVDVAPAPVVTAKPAFTGTGLNDALKFADGGYVPDDDEEIPPPPQPAVGIAAPAPAPVPRARPVAAGPAIGSGAVPAEAQAGAVPAIGGGPPTDISARRRSQPPPLDTAAVAGLKHLAEQAGIGQEAIAPALRQQALQRYARGAGGAPAVDMAAVHKKIDPNNQLSENARNMNAINSVYNFYNAAGDPAKAKSAAAQMLQYHRTAHSQYAAIAKAAFEGGNLDAATKALAKSYANIPDDKEVKFQADKDGNVRYTIIGGGPDGKNVEKGLMTPQQFGARLMKVGPADFDRHIITAAGEQRNDAQSQPIVKPGRGKAGGSGGDADVSGDPAQVKILEGVESHVDKWLNDLKGSKDEAKKKAAEDFSFKERKALETTMYHLQRNNDVPTAQAFDAAKAFLTAPEPKKEGDPIPFKVTREKGSDTATVQFAGDGQTVEMPVNQLRVMAKLRDNYLAEQEAKAQKAIEDAKPGAVSKAAGAVKDLLLNDPEGPGQAVKAVGQAIAGPGGLGGAYEGAKKVGGAVAGAVGDFATDFKEGLKAQNPGLVKILRNPNTSPNAENPDDRPL